MSEEKRVFKNIMSMGLSTVLPNLLNLVLSMVLARVLLYNGVNEFAYVIGYVTMIATASDLGLSSILVRDVARDQSKRDKYFRSYFSLRIVTSLLALGVSMVLVNFLPYQPYIREYIYIAAFSLFVFQIGQVFCALFQATERMELVTYGIAIQSVVYFVLGVITVRYGMGIWGLIYSSLAANVVMTVCYAYLARSKITGILPEINVDMFRYFIVGAIPFAISCILTIMYTNLDWFLISIMKNADVANYRNPYMIVAFLSFITTAYVTSVFPLFSKLSVRKDNSIRYASEKSLKYLLALMIPACIGTTLLADRIVYSIWEAEFGGAIPVLQVLIWMTVAASVNAIGGTLLNATHREAANMKNLAICTVCSILLNILLIPVMGAIGAGIVCVVTTSLYAALTIYLIRDEMKGIKVFEPVAKITLAALVMGVFIVFVPLNNLVLYIGASIVVYFAAFTLLGGISREDIDLVKKILKKSTVPAPETYSP